MGSAYVEFKLKEIEQLQALLSKMTLTAAQENTLLTYVGAEVETSIKLRIADTKTDPSGERWDDIKDSTRKYYERRGIDTSYRNLLHRTGFLGASVESQVKTGSVLVGATRHYAQWLNDGTSKMVSRRFIGISQSDTQLILSTVQKFLQGLTA